MQTNPLQLILTGGGYYRKRASHLERIRHEFTKDEPNATLIDNESHDLKSSSLVGVDRALTESLTMHKVLTKENLVDFQDLYDACKLHQELLNILKLKVYDYLAQAKTIREALPAVFVKLEAIVNGSEIDTIKQAVTGAVSQLKNILKPFLPQASTPQA
jgi:hypothetical protein